ncbi:MAG: DUF2089 family protein [bacterium]|jgi:hypothetical protein|nr:DUF2089 family protein [bacterium]
MDSWQRLTHWTQGKEFRIERVRLPGEDLVIEGSFEPSPLARLKAEDQVFIAAFVRSHGSIKQMEESFGLSYPTIKNRLRRLSEELSFLDVQIEREAAPPAAGRVGRLLDGLERGSLSVKEILEQLETSGSDPESPVK